VLYLSCGVLTPWEGCRKLPASTDHERSLCRLIKCAERSEKRFTSFSCRVGADLGIFVVDPVYSVITARRPAGISSSKGFAGPPAISLFSVRRSFGAAVHSQMQLPVFYTFSFNGRPDTSSVIRPARHSVQGDRCISYYCCRKELINIQRVTINRSLCCCQGYIFKTTRYLKLVLSLGLYSRPMSSKVFSKVFRTIDVIMLLLYVWI